MTILYTPRLRLEPYAERHFAGLLVLNSDPMVMRYVDGTTDTAEDVRAGIARVQERWATQGFSWWAFLFAGSDEVIGAGCIQHIENDPAQPLEIGWRLRPDYWGQGLATEAARAMADFTFTTLGAPCLYGVADPRNAASIRVMQRLGMHNIGLERHYGAECAVWRLDAPGRQP
ncbi:GNAT family N-acetyltransferase [Inquilinus sp. OTU3971]|uniref:GNAT family N-acetyltransferase n=1 Tax=Inquilinus sp. OTU3971 TaxID=3043855 RepID=UPI00313F1A6D